MERPHGVKETRRVRVTDDQENASSCYCPSCPTYTECMRSKDERLFCARGASSCELKELGCECGECTVARKYALSMNYYCKIGETGNDRENMNV